MQGLRRLELEPELPLEFASKLVFELPYRVAKAELLAVEAKGATCYLLHAIVFLKFFDKVDNQWGFFILAFLSNKVYF